jgi:ribosome-associated protein
MGKIKTLEKSQLLIDVAIKGLQDVKGENIICVDLKNLDNSVCDYFIICTGTSSTHVNALASSVKKEVKKTLKENPWHSEGFGNAEWVLLDYVNVVVHVFQEEYREFYNLESLWADAEITQVKQA